MTIEETEKVDIVALPEDRQEVILLVADHLPWPGDERGKLEHVWMLQEKLNTYIQYVESGDLFLEFPNARDRRVVIVVGHKYQIPQDMEQLIKKMGALLADAGIDLRFEYEPG